MLYISDFFLWNPSNSNESERKKTWLLSIQCIFPFQGCFSVCLCWILKHLQRMIYPNDEIQPFEHPLSYWHNWILMKIYFVIHQNQQKKACRISTEKVFSILINQNIPILLHNVSFLSTPIIVSQVLNLRFIWISVLSPIFFSIFSQTYSWNELKSLIKE